MKEQLIQILMKYRALIMRNTFSAKSYTLPIRSVYPLSRKFGLDRGTPIDRYYIEEYLQKNAKHIKGVCLEIGDNRYTNQFGTAVTKSVVLDVNTKNPKADIIGDLRHAPQIKSNTFDCILLTQVIGMIDDLDSVMKECHRILRPNGVLIITTSSLAPVIDYDYSFWRFTVKSLEYLFTKQFNKKNVQVESYGNALTSIYYYVGGVQEELAKKELEYNDKYFPCIIAGKAVKK